MAYYWPEHQVAKRRGILHHPFGIDAHLAVPDVYHMISFSCLSGKIWLNEYFEGHTCEA